MKTYYYSTNYYPPAPVVEIVLISAAENLQVGPLTGMADSGADGTIIPTPNTSRHNTPTASMPLVLISPFCQAIYLT